MDLLRPGRAYTQYVPFVGTTVFHWFRPTEGNVSGPWQPLGGRSSWSGEPDFWVGQIKQIMMANIDAVYLHCINNFEEERINYFRACNRLRHQGWEIPKIAPFLDPFYLWREEPIDVATKEGKDEFVSHYIRFFEQYLSVNEDALAETDLLRIDGKIVLTMWWSYSLVRNAEKLTREDVTRRLVAALGDRIPSLSNGIYMMTTALVDPDISVSDERMIMFSGYAYAIHCIHKGMDVWHVQAGYWDQNIRTPGYFLPRNGGKNYRSAWEAVVSSLPHVQRVYVESWNEYDEGSGIYASDPSEPLVNPGMQSNADVFSSNGDPFEYINTTAHGAALINRRPEDDAVVLAVEAPTKASAGSQIELQVVVRNEGNARWSGSARYGLLVQPDLFFRIDDQEDEIPTYGGIFRGRTATLRIKLPVATSSGPWRLVLSMAKDAVPFGQSETVTIQVGADASGDVGDRSLDRDFQEMPLVPARGEVDGATRPAERPSDSATASSLSEGDFDSAAANDEIRSLRAEIAALRGRLDQQRVAFERLNQSLSEKNATLSAVLNSKSWRITELLRRLSSSVRPPR